MLRWLGGNPTKSVVPFCRLHALPSKRVKEWGLPSWSTAARRALYALVMLILSLVASRGVVRRSVVPAHGKHQEKLRGSWEHGRYHHHLPYMNAEDPEYHRFLSKAGGAGWTESLPQMQCPPFNGSLLPPDVLSRRVFVALNLRDNEGVMSNLIRQLLLLAEVLSGPDQLMVSVFESNSQDATLDWLKELEIVLRSLDVPYKIVSGDATGTRQSGEERIAFLSRMRNKALAPLLESSVAYDHVVFINDVFFCAYDILRLMMYDADLACGVDLLLEPSPWHVPKYRWMRDNELVFYDSWVARDEKGQRFSWGSPFALNAYGQEYEEVKAYPHHVTALPAFCCWNGMAVIKAEPFYKGLRFHTSRPSDGVQSECTNFCLDLWANGYSKVVVDPQVKLTYDEPTYERLLETQPSRYPDLYRVNRHIKPAPPPKEVETCLMVPGPDPAIGHVYWEDCFNMSLPRALKRAYRLDKLCPAPAVDRRPIPRRFIQLAPVDSESGPVSSRWSSIAPSVWWDWAANHVDWEILRYDHASALRVIDRHMPLLYPVLNRLAEAGEWEVWRLMVIMALLYHHGGVYVSPEALVVFAPGADTPSLDCVIGPHDTIVWDVARQLCKGRTWLERSSEALGVGVVASERHSPAVQHVVDQLFAAVLAGKAVEVSRWQMFRP